MRAALCLLALILPLRAEAQPAQAADGPVAFRYCVTGVRTFLNLRAGPGTDHGTLGTLPAASCAVEGVRWRTRDWVLVEHEGTLGWAALAYLRPVE